MANIIKSQYLSIFDVKLAIFLMLNKTVSVKYLFKERKMNP